MQPGIISIFLFSLLAGEGVEVSAIREFRQQRFDHTSLLLELLVERKRARKEPVRSWQEEKVRVSYLAARVALMRKQYPDAIRWLKPVYFKHRKDSEVRDYLAATLAQAYSKAKQPQEAIQVYEWMLKELGWRWRRQIQHKLLKEYSLAGQWKSRIALLKKVQRNPGSFGGKKWVWWNLIQAYSQSGQYKQAAQEMRRYLLYYPTGRWAKQIRATLAQWQQQKLCVVKPIQWHERQFELVRLVFFSPQRALREAKVWWDGLSAKQRTDKFIRNEYLLLQARAWIQLQKGHQAVPLLLEILKEHHISKRAPQYLRQLAIRIVGKLFRDLGLYEQGEKVLHRYAERYPQEYRVASWAAYQSAWMALYQEKYAKAYRLFGEYMRVYPDAARRRLWRVRWFQAWCKFRTGQYREAIARWKQLKSRARHATDRRRCEYWSARAEERRGDWQKARKLYSALAMDSPLSFYGLLSQHRLYWLEVMLPQQNQTTSCMQSLAPEVKLSKKQQRKQQQMKKHQQKWHPALYRPEPTKAFTVGGKYWADLLSHSLRAKDTGPDVSPEVADFLKNAAHEANQPAIFPTLPTHCKRARWVACKAWRRAQWLARLGLSREAAQELVRGRGAIKRSLPHLLASIRWLRSVGAFHESVLVSYLLPGPQPRKGLSLDSWMKILYPPAFFEYIMHYAKRSGISPAFAWAIMREESLYQPQAQSHVGAKGLMQVINTTGQKIAQQLGHTRFRPVTLFQPKLGIEMGTWYLGQLVRKFGGHMLLAAAGYNAGPHRIAVWLEKRRHLSFDEFVEELYFTETRIYVKRVFRTYAAYSFLYFRRLPKAPTTVAVRVHNNIDF